MENAEIGCAAWWRRRSTQTMGFRRRQGVGWNPKKAERQWPQGPNAFAGATHPTETIGWWWRTPRCPSEGWISAVGSQERQIGIRSPCRARGWVPLVSRTARAPVIEPTVAKGERCLVEQRFVRGTGASAQLDGAGGGIQRRSTASARHSSSATLQGRLWKTPAPWARMAG